MSLKKEDLFMVEKQTKIICTLGPASDNYDTILRMAQEGMNIVRLNFSHGTHEEHLARINTVRKVEKENGINLGIMLDTKGPEIRLGVFKNDAETYQKGEIVTIQREHTTVSPFSARKSLMMSRPVIISWSMTANRD